MAHKLNWGDIHKHHRGSLDPMSRIALTSDIPTILKFGRNAAVGTSEEDIWLYGGEETLLTSAATMYASCTDNTNGVGQVLVVEGLDANWVSQEGRVTLTGQTQAAITKEDGSAATWTRIHRAYQISAAPDPVGDVYIAESDTLTLGVPDTATKVHAYIDFTDAAQQTQQAMYTVPAGHVALIFGGQAYMNAPTTGTARYVTAAIEIAELAEGATVANPSWTPRRRVFDITISTDHISTEHMLIWPIIVDELTDINMRAVASASSDVSASMELLVLPKET